MFAGFLKTLGLPVEDVGRICLWSKPLQDPNTKRKDHENPNRPSPANGFDNIAADDGSEDRANKGAYQENCDTNNLFKTGVPNLQVRMGILIKGIYIGNGSSAESGRRRAGNS
jgi:hypothetical protein